ncbi:class I SAM-dependent rRNA methyltransferase [Candidatus Marifrigoribacter sp. Uisw_064]|uniref:class I SAM-dependent rRNA methyltransferase n=1 Tax=Candidatus Marifrigoribacter sp. Uisw_064 TaxID=3230970 RepID=UPI003D497AC5
MYHISIPEITTQTLAVKLNKAGERSVLNGHPWIFSDSILKINKEGSSGDIAIIFSQHRNQVIGVGLYDLDSPIRIKMIHHGSGAKLNAAFFEEKIQKAYSIRQALLKTNTNSYRLLFGENDGFPGFIADVYANVLVIKLYSAIWYPFLNELLDHLIISSQCDCVVLRLSRKLQQQDQYNLKDGQVIYGVLENDVVEFVEHDVTFTANVIKGHKTGYFLDHRANRKRVGELSKGKTVLDVFSYAGGFSVHALANNAKEVTSLDISKHALELALANGRLNPHNGKHHILAGDAFSEMRTLISEKKTFEVVVIDPPSFAKSAKEVEIAKKKYAELAFLGAKLTSKGGMLVLASCSSRVSAEDFFEINKKTLQSQPKKYTMIDATAHDIDHPISFKEGAYLKCGYYKF